MEPRAVFKVLETLFSPDLEVRLKIKIDEKNILTSAGFPLAEGTKKYMDRNNPFFSNETLDQVKALFGLVLSVGSTLLVILKWFKGEPMEPEKPPTDDDRFADYINRVLGIEQEFDRLAARGTVSAREREQFLQQLTSIKSAALHQLTQAHFANAQLPEQLLLIISDTRSRLEYA